MVARDAASWVANLARNRQPDLPAACRFAPRCLTRIEKDVTLATELHPELRPVAPGHDVRCWVYHDVEGNLLPEDEPVVEAGR